MNLVIGDKYLIKNEIYLLETVNNGEYHFVGVSPLAHKGWYLYPEDGLDLVQALSVIEGNE